MGTISIKKLHEVVASLSVRDSRYVIDFDSSVTEPADVRDLEGTKYYVFKLLVTAAVPSRKEEVKFIVDVLNIPHETPTGFVVKGKNKQVVDEQTMSNGWYIKEKTKSFPLDHARLQTERGPSFTVFPGPNYELRFGMGGKNDPSISLGKFLKALTGKSYLSLSMELGEDSFYVQQTFKSKEEPSRDVCLSELYQLLATVGPSDFKTNLKTLSSEEVYPIIASYLLTGRKVYLGDTADVRLLRSLSYSYRCKGMYLREPVTVGKYSFQENALLTSTDLEIMDHIPLDEITVSNVDGKIYVVRKHAIHNFRALGMTLLEDVETAKGVIKSGTVLTVKDLKEIALTSAVEIKVLDYNQDEIVVKRRYFDGSLNVDDLIGFMQVYLNSLAGMNLYDDVYSSTNQNLVTLNTLAASHIRSNCLQIINMLFGDEGGVLNANTDLLTRRLNMQPLHTNSLLDFISDPSNRQAQASELNNSSQQHAKNFKMGKFSVKRSSGSMINVQDSQFGKIDSIEGPESSKLGMSNSRTIMSEVNSKGFLMAPYMRVENGVVADEDPVYLTWEEEEGEFIASWDETFHTVDKDGNKVLKEKVFVRSASTFLEVPLADVRYCQYSPFDDMSPSRVYVTFPQNSQAKRQLMASNQSRQVVPLLKAERAYVNTGGESLHGVGFFTAERALEEYYYEQSITEESLEVFKARTLKLANIATHKENKIVELDIVDFNGPSIRLEIPFLHKAASGALFSYEINTRTNLKYSGKDVIVKNLDVNIDKVDLEMYADFGHFKPDPSIFNQAISPARNFLVAYKNYKSSTIDDAIGISDEVIGMNLTQAMDVYKESYELRKEVVDPRDRTVEVESFRQPNGAWHIEPNGLPRVGTFLKAGDVVIGVKSELRSVNRNGTAEQIDVTPRDITLSARHEGQVVYASIDNGVATVLIVTPKDTEAGDKYAGRHGNKGVIANIIPRWQMPYDPITGMRIQFILNEQGIPSRINISQLIEGSAQFAMMKRGKHAIITPFLKDSTELVRQLAAAEGVKPMRLIDGRTGQYFKRPINVVVLYMWPLEHKSSHKSKYVGLNSPLDPVFCQPSKGDGGQAIGEMETWALEAAGARKVLQDLMSIQSDDLEGQSLLRRSIEEDPVNIDIEGNNSNDVFFQALLRGLGVDPQHDKNGDIVFKPLTDAATRSLSNMPLDLYNKKSLENGQVFGHVGNSMGRFQSRKNWGWIPLKCEIVHPFFIVKGKLNNLFLLGFPKGKDEYKYDFPPANFLWDLIACKKYIKALDFGRFAVAGSNEPDAMTGMSALIKLLRDVRVEDSIYHLQDAITRTKSPKSELEKKKHIYKIKSFLESGIKLSDYVISCLPIMPLAMRPKADFERREQDFDFYYKRIIDEVIKYSSSITTEVDKFSIFLRIAEFVGLKHGKDITPDPKYKPLIKYFTGREGPENKHGRLRESLIKKRQLMSGRTPIIPSRDPSRSPRYIGLPFEGVVEVWRTQLSFVMHKEIDIHGVSVDEWDQLLALIASNREMFNRRADSVLFNEPEWDSTRLYETMYDIIKKFVEGYTDEDGNVIYKKRVVLAGRQPTLHVFNIRAYYVKIVTGKCIEVPPLVCPLYNADFDGDQMWFVALMNWEAMDEAMELMGVDQAIVNPKDGSIILNPSQDMRLGMYFATMLYDNVDHISKHPKYASGDFVTYRSLDILQADLDKGTIEYHDLVSIKILGRHYLSTAGRIMFNSFLPENSGFTDREFENRLDIPNIAPKLFSDLRFDGLVSGTGGKRKTPKYVGLSEVLAFCNDNYPNNVTVDTIHKMSEFGFNVADISGISISLDDFVEYPSTQIHIDQAKVYADKINKRYFLGMLSEQERKEEMIYLYTQCKEKIKNSFMAQFERNNNLFIMFDSGARGNEGQIIQSCGIVGILKKTKDDTLEVPILSNYIRGLSAFDTLQASYSNRVGVSSSQNETQVSGALGRLSTYVAGGVRIIAEDCGAPKVPYKVAVDNFTGKVKNPKGVVSDIQILEGKILANDPAVELYLKNFLGESGEINQKCIEILVKNKIRRVSCQDGVYTLVYKISKLMKYTLKYRESENLDHLIRGKYISDATIKYIENNDIEYVNMRTLLDCRSVGGVCARCYGLMYNDKKLPPVGKNIGAESSECISEPAAQLNLNSFHTGGVAGASVSRGVETLASLLQTGFTDKLPHAVLAKYDGYVSVGKDKRRPIIIRYPEPVIEDDGKDVDLHEVHFIKEGKLIVEDGEYVTRFTPISTGAPFITEDLVNPDLEEMKLKQMSLLEAQYLVFQANNIDVYARHFEVFAKIQISLCDIFESNDPNFPEGGTFQVMDVVQNGKGNIKFIAREAHSTEVMEHYGGLLTSLAHQDLASRLGGIVTYAKKSKATGFVGKMMIGAPVDKPSRKIFDRPALTVRAQFYSEDQETKIVESLKFQELVQSDEPVHKVVEDIDWDDLTGEDSEEELVAETESTTPEKPEPELSLPRVGMDKSSAFGGNDG